METTNGQVPARERELLDEVLKTLLESGSWPTVRGVRAQHRQERVLIDRLVERGWLTVTGTGNEGHPDEARYAVPAQGLLRCSRALAEQLATYHDLVLSRLQDAVHSAAEEEEQELVSLEALCRLTGLPKVSVEAGLEYLLLDESVIEIIAPSPDGMRIEEIGPSEAVLEVSPLRPLLSALFEELDAGDSSLRLADLQVQGYRVFAGLRAELTPLTVVIGANATGKSSLIDLLRLLSFASTSPLPPAIDPRGPGRTLFHVAGPDRIACSLGLSREPHKPLRYELEIHGPVGSPRIIRERLLPAADQVQAVEIALLDFSNGRGTLRSPAEWFSKPHSWSLQPGELALRRALDPELLAPSRLQQFLSSWRFYGSLDVSWNSPIRKPTLPEQEPLLNEDGSNLSAVLFNLLTGAPEAWQELELMLQSAVPGFQSLNVRPQGQGLMGTFREVDQPRELTLADLSDGSLRFLCWAALCLSPRKPPLICIDEPEVGLHPRTLPFLASLLRDAARESQLLVTTHSPYFLSQFSLDEVAVMKKVEGGAIMLRPASNEGLRREIEELGSEALGRMHISDELEART